MSVINIVLWLDEDSYPFLEWLSEQVGAYDTIVTPMCLPKNTLFETTDVEDYLFSAQMSNLGLRGKLR